MLPPTRPGYCVALALGMILANFTVHGRATYAATTIEEVLALVFEQNSAEGQLITEAATLLATMPDIAETGAALEARAARHSIDPQSLKIAQLILKRCVEAGAKRRPECISLSIRSPQVLVLEREPISSINTHVVYAPYSAIDRAHDRESLKKVFQSGKAELVQGEALVFIARFESAEVFVSDAELANKRGMAILDRINEHRPLVASCLMTYRDEDGRTKAISSDFKFDGKTWVLQKE
jgi:hypothetical protein